MPSHPNNTVSFDGRTLTIDAVRRVAEEGVTARVTPQATAGALRSRAVLDAMAEQGVLVHGVTTGYGEPVPLPPQSWEEAELQHNLVRSHSCGVGPLFAEDEARAIMAARLNTLAKGYSAIRPVVLDRLSLYLNRGIVPAIPEVGSLGAGDLVPLAHLASTLIGEGYVLRDGRPVETAAVLAAEGIDPLELRFKEGLALLNGASATTGVGSLVVERALLQTRQAELVSAMLNDVLCGSAGPFLAQGHETGRPHRGQADSAANLRVLLAGSRTATVPGESGRRSQRAYSLRAVPQILGAVRDTLRHARGTLETELNSAGDNPLFFEDGEVFHGANFHGQPLAFVLDFVTIALTQLGVLAERQLDRLLSGHPDYGLPEFLVAASPGLNCGFAGAQYPASALVAENRTIGPASTQSVPSNGGHQDVVSMSLLAARNARRVLGNNNRILAVEYLAVAQAVDVSRRFDELSPASQATYDMVRSLVPTLGVDRYMADDIELVAAALSRGEFLTALAKYTDVELR
ncbi:histidine ammonia-lyase [Streptomyces sp. PanSC19]|uniref:tyrosine 2,3-aminomutase n=1 Tax=Streptomyces sp. PanSC19 TaxID=1520455 RepID=UPI000F4952CA|nr:tyrosine 2,3-aminomutase [Streptomyces sp. PanSC19]ROQ23178.1 histidine ammonia-lyase [Streptomyces sp. PanSC19]